MTKLIFYTTAGCHLCEHAALLLDELARSRQAALPFELEEVDISSEERLVELYGIRIPVVKNADTEKEIGWPFDLEGLASLF